jgi:hypothetical protein
MSYLLSGLPPRGLLTRFHHRAASRYRCRLLSASPQNRRYRRHFWLRGFRGMRASGITSRSSVSLKWVACRMPWLTPRLLFLGWVAGARNGVLRRNVRIEHPFAFLPSDPRPLPNFRPYVGPWVTYGDRKDIRRGIFGGYGNVSVQVGSLALRFCLKILHA